MSRSDRRYAKVRKAFDKPIVTMYAIQEKLSKMSVQIESARYVCVHAACLCMRIL